MKKQILYTITLLLGLSLNVFSGTPMNGSYTIDASSTTTGTNFQTFTDAMISLDTNGISGPVVFNVKSGTYTEQFVVGNITGLSVTDTILFRKDPSSLTIPTIEFNLANSTTTNYVVKLDSSRNITFDSLEFTTENGSSNAYGTAVFFDHRNDSITFRSCIFTGKGYASNNVLAAVVTNGLSDKSENLTFENNTFNGGTYGINMVGSHPGGANKEVNLVIRNNKFYNCQYYYIYVKYQKGFTIENNTLENTLVSNSTVVGIYSYLNLAGSMSGNTITLNSTRSSTGIYSRLCNGYGVDAHRIENNMISLIGTPSSSGYYQRGIYLADAANMGIFHNTININDVSSYCAAFYAIVSTTNWSYKDINVRNNIFTNSKGGYAVSLQGGALRAAYLKTLDYNVYNSSGANPFRNLTTNISSLAAFVTLTSRDSNSLFGDPGYYSSTNLHLQGVLANNVGDTSVNTAIDIDGDSRTATIATVDIGADEYTPPPCPSPTSISSLHISYDSIRLTWINGPSDVSWMLEYGPAGFTAGTGTILNSAQDTTGISGLTALTCYDVYVRSICTASDSSVWIGPLNFCTPCGPYTPTYYQDFLTITSSVNPTCWTEGTGVLALNSTITLGSSLWKNYNFAKVIGGSKCAGIRINGTGKNEWLISPLIDLGDGTTSFEVEFDIALTERQLPLPVDSGRLGYDDKIAFLISTDNGTTWSDTNIIRLWDSADIPYYRGEKFIYNLTSNGYTGVVKFAFFASTTVSNEDMELTLDNFRVKQAPSCAEPIAISQVSSTTNSVTLDWDSRGTSAWIVEYGPIGFNIGNGTTLNSSTKPFVISGLSPSSQYDVYVKSVCSVGDTSSTHGIFLMNTQCDSVGDFCTGFENVHPSNRLPICWTKIVSSTSTSAGISPNAVQRYNGQFCLRMSNSSGTNSTLLLISPELYDLPLGTHRMNFMAKEIGASGDSSFYVGTMSNPLDPSTFTPYDTIPVTTAYANYKISFDKYTGTDRYVVFLWTSRTTNDNIYLDDLCWEETPSCEKAVGGVVLGSDSTSINLGWNNDTTHNTFIVEYGLPGFTLGTGNTQNFNTNYAVVTNLLSSTDYCFYISAICNNGDTSLAIGPFCGKTFCGAILPLPYVNSFDLLKKSGPSPISCNTSEKLTLCFRNNTNTNTNNWQPWKNSTPTSGTGPSDDVTGGGKYLLMEGTGFSCYGDTNSFDTPYFDLNAVHHPKMKFSYFMNGTNIGGLYVIVNNFDKTKTDTIFNVNGDQGSIAWSDTTISLIFGLSNSYLNEKVMFTFHGIHGNGSSSDIAIDEFSIKEYSLASIDNLDNAKSKFVVYPNPNNGLFSIANKGSNQLTNIILIDVQGRIIYQENKVNFNSNSVKQIDISQFNRGIYILVLSQNGKNEHFKIIVR